MAEQYVPVYHPSRPGESAPERYSDNGERQETTSTSLDSPVISVQSKRVACSCGSPTTLMCSVRGTPSPTVEWIREGRGPCQGPKYRTLCEPPRFYLIISDTCAEDAGDYRIVAKNEKGESKLAMLVLVLTPEAPNNDETHPDVSVAEFSSAFAKLISSQSTLMNEFFSLDLPWDLSQHAGNLHCNEHKNRYCNIFPYDHSRVVLSVKDTDPAGSDFINASHMEDGYIASQGPLPHTFGDFWKMVWEYNIHTIAMVTKISDEHSIHMKCHRYWPKKGTLKEGQFNITLKFVQSLPYCEIRMLELANEAHPGDLKPREVCHFQFLSWPEYGVPKNPTDLLEYRRRVREYHSSVAGPLLVHCSAGVGRTGTFLCLDMLLQKIEKGHKINVFNLVRRLRHRRERTVETPEQYMLIHAAIAEAIKTYGL